MIRSSKERKNLSDAEIATLLKPHEQYVMQNIGKEIIYDFFPFVLASAFNNDCIWDDSTLEFEYIDAIDYLRSSSFPGYKELDIDRVKKIMEEKYSLKITNDDPIKIEKIQ